MSIALATEQDYIQQLLALRPYGPAWPETDALLESAAVEFAADHNRAADLIEQADPRTTTDLFTDWERVAGLPDTCITDEQTLAQRRATLLARLTTIGGQSAQYFIGLAAQLGYTITVQDFDLYDVTDDVSASIYGEPWQYVFQVNATLNTVFVFAVNDSVDDPLAAWSNVALECTINRYKPAHTIALFSYQ